LKIFIIKINNIVTRNIVCKQLRWHNTITSRGTSSKRL